MNDKKIITNKEIKNLKSKYNEFNKTYGFRRINPFYIYLTASIISLIWCGIIGYYSINSIYNWSSLSRMLPHEFGGFLAGTIMPIGFIWMIALYIDRNINSNYEKEVIYPFLQSIIDPHGDTSVITNVIKNKIETETIELKKTIDTFASHANQLEELHKKIANNISLNVSSMQTHEGRLNSISVNLNKSTNDIDIKTKNILDTISENITILHNTTNAIDNKTTIITSKLVSETSKFETTIENLNIQKDNIDIATQIALTRANDISNTFFSIGEKIVSSTEIANTYAIQMLDKISEKTNDFVVKSNISAQRISSVSDDIRSSIDTVNTLSIENKKLATNALNQISNHSNNIIDNITNQTKNFEDKTSTILSTVSTVSNKFDNINETMSSMSDGIIKQFENIKNEINKQKENLFETSNNIAQNITNLSIKISDEKNNFIQSIADVKDITIDTTNNIKQSSSEIIATSDNIKSAANEINALMENSKSNLSNQAETTLKFATEIKNTLKNQINDLEEVVNTVSTQTRLGEISIESQGNKLSQLTENLFLKMDTMNGKISSSINNILNLTSQIDDKFNNMNQNILKQTSTASKIISDNIDNTITQSNNFQDISSSFNEKSVQNNTQMTNLLSELKQQTIGLESTTKQTSELIGSISNEIIKASQIMPELNSSIGSVQKSITQNNTNIEEAIETTEKKSKLLIQNLNEISHHFTKFASEKTSEIEFISNNSTQAITKVASYTNKLTKEIQEGLEKLEHQHKNLPSNLNNETEKAFSNNIDNQTDENFLNKAGYIIEKLNSISIDLSSLLSPEANSELWNKYNAGHKGVFSKYLNHILSKKQIADIKALYQNNADFKNYTKSYISEFDILMSKASTTDKGDILLATITTTDIGKTYMILKEII